MRLPDLASAADVVRWSRQLVLALSRVLGTRAAAGISADKVELALGTSTWVEVPGLRPGAVVLLAPVTAAAVAAAPWVSTIEAGQFAITHGELTAGSGALVWWVVL